jgi:predicted secreted hydrolase
LGSHPQFRTEWWYVTGWLLTERGESLGFQITFFRTKPNIDANNPSDFAPRQIMVAHCALSDPQRGTLWQDQKVRRAALGLAGAAEGSTHVWIDRWSLKREAQTYVAKVAAEDFAFDLALTETQPALINGEDGVSRKGPQPPAASYYYSLPHMQVAGTVSRKGSATQVTGEAWFDHEWSSEYLDTEAAGWDWIGINLQDGGALMAFQIRGLDGKAHWAGGTIRTGAGLTQILRPEDVEFRAGRRWTSPRTGIAYPVEWTVRADGHEITLKALFDDQENDTRLSTGAIYWEGAVRAFDVKGLVGRGYLELTGYGERLRLR